MCPARIPGTSSDRDAHRLEYAYLLYTMKTQYSVYDLTTVYTFLDEIQNLIEMLQEFRPKNYRRDLKTLREIFDFCFERDFFVACQKKVVEEIKRRFSVQK